MLCGQLFFLSQADVGGAQEQAYNDRVVAMSYAESKEWLAW